jgi:hypothetical protein
MCLKGPADRHLLSNTLVRTGVIFGIKFEWQFK